jgi:hypothetical protein
MVEVHIRDLQEFFPCKNIAFHRTCRFLLLLLIIVMQNFIPISTGMARPELDQYTPKTPKRQKLTTIENMIINFCGDQHYKQRLDASTYTESQNLELSANVTLPNYSSHTFRCQDTPSLILTAVEPLLYENIISVHSNFVGNTNVSSSESCTLPLTHKSEVAPRLSFWMKSSYTSESEHFIARVRFLKSHVTDRANWQVNAPTNQLDGENLVGCSLLMGEFPPVDVPPAWLQTPDKFDSLASNEPYVYLAGRLIAQGIVDAKDCPGFGLLQTGYANSCGLERARDEVTIWQNQFDAQILQVSKATGVPGQLIKNVIAQESQFWPGTFNTSFEFGLGRMTEMGADSVLLWDPSFFTEFCPLVLNNHACKSGYVNLSKDNQALLRGALAAEAGMDCPDCPNGFNLGHAYFSINLLAHALLASCAQVDQLIYNIILYNTNGISSSEVSVYNDLWRFVLVNYNAGPGCLSDAIHYSWIPGNQLTWDDVVGSLVEGCKGAIEYVENITR